MAYQFPRIYTRVCLGGFPNPDYRISTAIFFYKAVLAVVDREGTGINPNTFEDMVFSSNTIGTCDIILLKK